MSERIGSHGWRIWKEKGLPQEVVPLSDAEGVVEQLEAKNGAMRALLKRAGRFNVLSEIESAPAWNTNGAFQQEIDVLLTGGDDAK